MVLSELMWVEGRRSLRWGWGWRGCVGWRDAFMAVMIDRRRGGLFGGCTVCLGTIPITCRADLKTWGRVRVGELKREVGD